MEGASQAVVGSSEQKIPASLSLFLKSERIPVLLNEGKGHEYRLFHDFQPVPLAYQPRAQISNHGRACTQALLLYIIVTAHGKQCPFFSSWRKILIFEQ
jgi:hypothetical protein